MHERLVLQTVSITDRWNPPQLQGMSSCSCSGASRGVPATQQHPPVIQKNIHQAPGASLQQLQDNPEPRRAGAARRRSTDKQKNYAPAQSHLLRATAASHVLHDAHHSCGTNSGRSCFAPGRHSTWPEGCAAHACRLSRGQQGTSAQHAATQNTPAALARPAFKQCSHSNRPCGDAQPPLNVTATCVRQQMRQEGRQMCQELRLHST